jgi:predicted permease
MTMTTAAIVLLLFGVAYCWWKKGTDAPVAVIFTFFGVALSQTQFGPMIVRMMNQFATSLDQGFGQLF